MAICCGFRLNFIPGVIPSDQTLRVSLHYTRIVSVWLFEKFFPCINRRLRWTEMCVFFSRFDLHLVGAFNLIWETMCE